MAPEGENASQSLLRNVCCTKEIAYNFNPLSQDIRENYFIIIPLI